MANALFAYKTGSTIVLWSDANADPVFSQRNFIICGSQCIVLHGDYTPSLQDFQNIIKNPQINNLPADQLSATVTQGLRSSANTHPNVFGFVVCGFINNVPTIIGRQSWQGFNPLIFPKFVTAETQAPIWGYLTSILNIIPDNLDSVIDMCLIGGKILNKTIVGTLPGSVILVLSPNQSPYWLSDIDIAQRQSKNERRLQAIQLHLIHQLKGSLQ